jgi:hypothetical protein
MFMKGIIAEGSRGGDQQKASGVTKIKQFQAPGEQQTMTASFSPPNPIMDLVQHLPELISSSSQLPGVCRMFLSSHSSPTIPRLILSYINVTNNRPYPPTLPSSRASDPCPDHTSRNIRRYLHPLSLARDQKRWGKFGDGVEDAEDTRAGNGRRDRPFGYFASSSGLPFSYET